MRKARPVALETYERDFRLDEWMRKHVVIEDDAQGAEWVVGCPRCGQPKLAVHTQRKAWQCWTCTFHGWSPTTLVAAFLNVPTHRAAEIMAAQGLGRVLGRIDPLEKPQQGRRGSLPLAALPPIAWPAHDMQRRYAHSRGISDAMIGSLMMGTVLPSPLAHPKATVHTLAGHLIFPVWDQFGRLVYWQTRSVVNKRMMNMPTSCNKLDHALECVCKHEEWGLPPTPFSATGGEVVLGLHLIERGKPAFVVEGPTDVAVCGLQFCARMGAVLHPGQAQLIAGMGPSEVIIIGDGDKAAREKLPAAVELMNAYLPSRGVLCPEARDPADLGRGVMMSIALEAPSSAFPMLQRPATSIPKVKPKSPLFPSLAKHGF